MSEAPESAAGLREQASATPNAITALELRVRALELENAQLRELVVSAHAKANDLQDLTAPPARKKAASNKRARKRS